jgi:cytochrome bd-type quinol oxidase subunit 2
VRRVGDVKKENEAIENWLLFTVIAAVGVFPAVYVCEENALLILLITILINSQIDLIG